MTSIKVPPLGESIVEATVSRWLKKEGEAIAPGDTLVELETDKITVEVPALNRGVLKKRLRAEGDVVKVDDVLAEVDESATAAATPAPAQAQAAAAAKPSAAPSTATSAPPAAASAGSAGASTGSEVRASPAAKRLASEEGVDLAGVSGTGRGGVVSKPDVIEQSAARGAGAPARAESVAAGGGGGATPSAGGGPRAGMPASANGARETREKMSTRRKRIAEHLLEAQHATAHLT